jgi:hypothetical protein
MRYLTERVVNIRVNSGRLFPQSHSAHWDKFDRLERNPH